MTERLERDSYLAGPGCSSTPTWDPPNFQDKYRNLWQVS